MRFGVEQFVAERKACARHDSRWFGSNLAPQASKSSTCTGSLRMRLPVA
jgi:hypothetical protein